MASDAFNGSTISIAAGDQVPLLDINYTEAGAEIDVTGCADATHTYEAGIEDVTATYTIVGGNALSVGDEGAIAVAWFDGSSESMTNGVVTNIVTSGSLDDKITTAVTVRPTAA